MKEVTLMSHVNGSISPVDDNMSGEDDIFLRESDFVAYIIVMLSCINQIRNTSKEIMFSILILFEMIAKRLPL